LADLKPPLRRSDDPKPGHFLVRLIKNGPLVPAAIFHEFGMWRAEFNGEIQPAPNPDPLRAGKVVSIWHSFRERLNEVEYDRRLKRAPDPACPSSRPRERLDIAKRHRF
jgi:hypothetical protein